MIIQSRNVYYEEQLQPKQVEIADGKIVNVLPYGIKPVDQDYGENWILPGLIDIHNHGYNGGDANHATEKFIREWMAYLPHEGVTATCPSTSSCPKATMLKGMRVIGEVMEKGCEGTRILGVYSEGPFMSLKFRGAQDPANLTVPTRDIVDEYDQACLGHLIYVMVAPEMLQGDMSVIRYLVSRGKRVACGHTGATFEQISQAREAGVVSFTHTYNGMRGLHHREPGVVGAAMYYHDMYAELIGDGVHVSFPAMKVLAEAKGKDRLISITDSVFLKGLPVGKYVIEGQNRNVCADGVGRLDDGTICGSCNRLNIILKREIEQAGISMVTAINSCTANPARMLGWDDRIGFIRPGWYADLCVLDQQFEPVQTYIAGKARL
jgi:N-acetylglucosamine-6-phosphate deacetylase